MIRFLTALVAVLMLVVAPQAHAADDIDALFTQTETNRLVMKVEAALAQAQAELGIIPQDAADEISRTATLEYAPIDDWEAEYDRVRHRMVALLNVWRRSLSPEASDALHLGATTVDIYDTVMIMQLRRAIELQRAELLEAEQKLLALALEHRDTPMIGRTLGQHALPITFGKKVAVWAGANRRNIERLDAVYCRLGTLGVMRGAVGTHLGLGPQGAQIERLTADALGLGPVSAPDWHGMRDVFGEYAAILAIIARVNAGIGEEVFTLQMTDIAEVYEERPGSAVSSSSMPHKRNPSRSEALMHLGRVVPAQATIILDDIVNAFERDNTSRPNRVLEEISKRSMDSADDLNALLSRLVVDEARMAANLERTDGMIMAQRLVLELQDDLGKEHAEELVAKAARASLADGTTFRQELLADPELHPLLQGRLDDLLDYRSYLGDAAGQVDRTIAELGAPPERPTCAGAR
ncbi:lyase family protein [Erythrobacter sp. GH1-10]|uniref:lyase family protein n=1 Tax=Erythrobacter sp. GH1-10 TaxID=3349334 RepID=UPI0038782C1D